jgi:selenocysteine-specific elongation factor
VNGGPFTLGTAGHIDHGKTALIGTLTGVDTDRLPEEKARGISITLGYARLRTPSGRLLSVVDVPGHERFVRTMVAGATGIDAFLMVIAADDGVMPQTLEHVTVLKALAVNAGVVVITKADIADPKPAMEEARELLPDSETIACSSRTGCGIDDVLAAIDRLVAPLTSRSAKREDVVLHIDRTFSLRGQGTIVTGTLWSGALSRGDKLELLPSHIRVRVRGLEVHDEPLACADAGQRVAVNLSGVRVGEVARGDVLTAPGFLRETTVVDCSLDLEDAQHDTQVNVHHGTREVPGRLVALKEDLWQLRLERPLLAADGDRIVVRRPSPAGTLGGGRVVDAHAVRHGGRPEIIKRLLCRRDGQPEPTSSLTTASKSPAEQRTNGVNELPPIPESELAALEQRLREAGCRPLSPTQLDAEKGGLGVLSRTGAAVRVSGELYAHADAVADARDRVIRLIENHGVLTLATLRDSLGISRKSAQALLEHFDATRVTTRLPDDSRVLSRRYAGKCNKS